jgi:hypothetical protein
MLQGIGCHNWIHMLQTLFAPATVTIRLIVQIYKYSSEIFVRNNIRTKKLKTADLVKICGGGDQFRKMCKIRAATLKQQWLLYTFARVCTM